MSVQYYNEVTSLLVYPVHNNYWNYHYPLTQHPSVTTTHHQKFYWKLVCVRPIAIYADNNKV